MSVFSDADLARFRKSSEVEVGAGGAVWTLRPLSGYELQRAQSLLLSVDSEGKTKFDQTQMAAHYAEAIACSVVALDGKRGELTADQARALPPDVFSALRDALDDLNGKGDGEDDEGN